MDGMNHGDMASSTVAHAMSSATGTAAAAATTAASGGMGGMSMGGSCKISMLWNWNTIDSCFIARSWHVKTAGAFAGSCIGVLLLVILLEALRRAGKEYDQFITWKHIKAHSAAPVVATSASPSVKTPGNDSASGSIDGLATAACAHIPRFRPSILQQAVRALLHTFQFAVAYFVMLLAMYYNGYIIICIFLGAYIGSFIFHWEYLTSEQGPTRAGNNPTVCCG
ncbi:high affinity copper transporter [Plectosphaerella plurivora]|uniref:Copper transport protein n=1 Tax=Plectosphaerella plurivora TaxID=936078 RepID=A0A9P8V310_9PEZI|nr:high affinity copper transporter [Plectosphaerella plurivora]